MASTHDDLEQRHSRFELKALLDTSRLLIESHDLDFVLNNLLLIIMGKLMISKSAVLLRTEKPNRYFIAHTKGKCKFDKESTVVLAPTAAFLSNSLIEVGVDMPESEIPELLQQGNFQMIINLRTSNRHLGFLCLGHKLARTPVSATEREFLESICITSSVAIANSYLIGDLKRTNRSLDQRVQELHTLFDLSKEFNTSVDRSQILRIFKFALMGQLFVRTFFILFDRNDEKTILVKNGVKSDPSKQDIDALFAQIDVPVFTSEVPELLEQMPSLAENGITLLVPLKLQNHKYAVIAVGTRANGEDYNDNDKNLLVSLGNLLVVSLQKTYLLEERIEKERLEKELRIAKSIQDGLFPNRLPRIEGLDIAAHNTASQEVGGDYYDIFHTSPDTVCTAIADVTGKGVPASLIMANLQSMIQALAPTGMPLDRACDRINDIVYKNTPPDIFITFFWCLLNTNDYTVQYVNAGHNPPMIFRQGKTEPEELRAGGIILGAMPTLAPYSSEKVALHKGDLLIMYTDGVTEVMDEHDEEYAEQRLIDIINANRHLSSKELIEVIISDVKTFCNGNFTDDLTMVVLNVL